MSIKTLSNGKVVANFSSPHSFEFTDGTILPAVSNEDAERLKITFIEIPLGATGDIELCFELSDDVLEEMENWLAIYLRGEIDVVFCPLPMITAIRNTYRYGRNYLLVSPFRAIRMEDRIKKLVSIDKQCI